MSNFHNLTIEDCLKKLKTRKAGLTTKEAQSRIRKYGENRISEEKSIGRIEIFLEQFKSPLIYILLVAGIISLFFKEYIDAGVIFAAVFLNTIIGFFQENKANNSLSQLKKMIEHKTLVYRDGREIEIDASNLTIGDIIILKAGNRVPADARIISSVDLSSNEASLTGESVPSEKNNKKINLGAPLADRSNMVFAGTIIVRGSGQAVITAIGGDTEIGKIAKLVKSTKEDKTPLQFRLAKLSRFFGVLALVISLVIIFVGVLQGRDILEMFLVAVAIAVSSIPEGLVVAVTVILVLGMQRILKQKALVRKLVAAEALGSTTVICSDKTGTLTEGKMNVSNIIIGENEFEIGSLGSRQDQKEAKYVSLALQIGMMCNDAVIENKEDPFEEWRIIGDPTETALLLAAHQSGLDQKKLLQEEPRISVLPFSSDLKYMVTLHKKKIGGYVIYEKGAPEKILKKSTSYLHKGKINNLNQENRKKLIKTEEDLTKRGLRVIGIAYRNFEDNSINKNSIVWDKIDRNLIFVGFIALKDPLRPEAKETINICKKAGIRPVIITGDHWLTARAIANEVGLQADKEHIITGEALDSIDDKELFNLVKKIDIYARVNPHHKLRIIQALQKRGEVVAMTGDGINDSPALKAADIGVCLGTGTDIAKETSDIILLDNNFKTIVSAIHQGRIIFDNIRKVITYLVSDSFSGTILVVGSVFLQMPLPIIPVQILWVNIINDGLPNFALAFEKGDDTIMNRKPIKKNEPIVNSEMKTIIFGSGLIRDFFVFGIYIFLFRDNLNLDYIRTIIFTSVGVDSLMYIYSLRDFTKPIWRINPFSNIYLVWATLISLGLLLIGIYWQPMQKVLSTVSLDLNSWLLIISYGFLSILLIEIVKHYFISKEKNNYS